MLSFELSTALALSPLDLIHIMGIWSNQLQKWFNSAYLQKNINIPSYRLGLESRRNYFLLTISLHDLPLKTIWGKLKYWSQIYSGGPPPPRQPKPIEGKDIHKSIREYTF